MEASKPNLPFKSTVMAQPKTAEDIEAIYGECDLGPLLELPSIRFLDIYPPFPPDFRNYNPTDDPRAGTKKFMLADFIVKILYKWDPNAVKAFMDFSKPFVWVRQEKNEIFRHTYVGRDDNKVKVSLFSDSTSRDLISFLAYIHLFFSRGVRPPFVLFRNIVTKDYHEND